MKILFTTLSLDAERGGGTAARTLQLVRNFSRQRHTCLVAAIQGGAFAEQLRADGIDVYVSGFIRIRFHFPFINLRRLMSQVRDAEIVHILGYWNLLSVVTALVAGLMGRPYVLCAAGEFAALDRRRPIAFLFHRMFGLRMVRGARMLVAITELEREQILNRFALPPDAVVVVPNGVEMPAAGEVATVDLPWQPFLLFVGRLAWIKGPDLLVEAYSSIAARFSDVALVMVGPDFGMREELERKVNACGLSGRVVFTGHLGVADRVEACRRALALVVPSRAEAMSLVALEAGIQGTPVLLTDQCGFDEVKQVGGGLVVAATVDGLSRGLTELLDMQGELKDMGERLRQYVAANFVWANIVQSFGKSLSNVIAGFSPAETSR